MIYVFALLFLIASWIAYASANKAGHLGRTVFFSALMMVLGFVLARGVSL